MLLSGSGAAASADKTKLGLSVGTSCFDSSDQSPMSELLDRADAALYRMKQERKNAP